MNANKMEMFKSKYLNSADLEGRQPVVKIKGFEIETLGQGGEAEKKPVMYFQGKEKGLVCNKTNWNTLIELFGPETDDWAGQSIKLIAMEVQFGNKMMLSLRISPQRVNLAAKPKAAPAPEPEHGEDLEDSEIPF